MGVDPWILEEVTSMDSGFASLWGFSEQSVEDLKHKLLCATLELEALRATAREEMRKKEENTNQLIHLLQIITRERDEARDQLQLLLNKITQPESPQMRQTRASSSITESDSLSGTPAESFFNTAAAAAASPELTSAKMAACTRQSNEYDSASAVIDGIAMKKPLPQKGKLLQAVLEAGPLLQTLLLAGPLPQWRNPPPLQQFQVPPVAAAAKAHSSALFTQKVVLSSHNLAHCSQMVPLDHEKSNGEFGVYAPKMTKRPMESLCMRSYENLSLKRQKTQCTQGV
ncbi:hypothetical protein Cni_G13487 [Canna indica]|uniref:Uncharacterized protein n=1 Tax=Canna indica TaxID=4628 RepID=A0AAQ3KA72_9LILI|nr:hypothetical protein Cni_G13487 [Canna indica]